MMQRQNRYPTTNSLPAKLPDVPSNNIIQDVTIFCNLRRLFHAQVGFHLFQTIIKTEEEEMTFLNSLIEFVYLSNYDGSTTLEIALKDFNKYVIVISDMNQFKSVYIEFDQKLKHFTSDIYDYPYIFCASHEDLWQSYKTDVAEPVSFVDPEHKFSHLYRISELNMGFVTCPSYSGRVLVPHAVTDSAIEFDHGCFSQDRFPVLSFIGQNETLVLRAGNLIPLGSGVKNIEETACLSDLFANSRNKTPFIVQLTHLPVEKTVGAIKATQRPRDMRTSIRGLEVILLRPTNLSLCLASLALAINLINESSLPEDYNASLKDDSFVFDVWNDTVFICLTAAIRTCHQLSNDTGTCVLVCEGKEAHYTPVICSLIHVLTRPFCRTIKGFAALVDIEWIGAGYPFRSRSLGVYSRKAAPMFLLFLNCVYSFLMLNKSCFEFNDLFLSVLHSHSTSSEFGNFVADSPKESSEKTHSARTLSLWPYLMSNAREMGLVNPLYNPYHEPTTELLVQNLHTWTSLFLASKSSVPAGEVWNCIRKLMNKASD